MEPLPDVRKYIESEKGLANEFRFTLERIKARFDFTNSNSKTAKAIREIIAYANHFVSIKDNKNLVELMRANLGFLYSVLENIERPIPRYMP